MDRQPAELGRVVEAEGSVRMVDSGSEQVVSPAGPECTSPHQTSHKPALKPQNLHEQAEGANVRGMRYYRVKRYAEAAKEFRDAIGADSP